MDLSIASDAKTDAARVAYGLASTSFSRMTVAFIAYSTEVALSATATHDSAEMSERMSRARASFLRLATDARIAIEELERLR